MPSGRVPLTARRVADTRREIATLALKLADERGWDSLTVADIADAADVSLRTYYRYFPRKQDVFMPLLEDATERLRTIFGQLTEGDVAERSAIALERSLYEFPGGLRGAHTNYGILLRDPTLISVWLFASLRAEPGFAKVLTASFPELDDQHDGKLLAAVIITCQRIGLQDWVAGPSGGSLIELVEQSVRRGLALA
nr:TetR/AcrR family transcriptional regulator [Streptomyces sp. NBC_00830]WTB35630.1 TetR/AcrR family transcriptional regulator [Streptomyces sp. NBC_00830]